MTMRSDSGGWSMENGWSTAAEGSSAAVAEGRGTVAQAARRRPSRVDRPSRSAAPMTRTHKFVNVFAMSVPMLCLCYAVYRLWGSWITPLDFGLLVAGYFLTCVGISIGYHRYFTHRSFKTSNAMVVA